MATDAEYVERISAFDRADLVTLWWEITQGQAPEWAPGKALEYLVLRAFQLEDAQVQWPYRVTHGDESGETLEQIDGAVYTDGLACLVECKDKNERINIEPIAKLRNQLLRRPGSAIGMVVSRSGFTEAAVTLARFAAPQAIVLWDGEEVGYAIRRECVRSALVKKYRCLVE